MLPQQTISISWHRAPRRHSQIMAGDLGLSITPVKDRNDNRPNVRATMSALPSKADMCSTNTDVCYGSKADMCPAKGRVCFYPRKRHQMRFFDCLFWANSGPCNL